MISPSINPNSSRCTSFIRRCDTGVFATIIGAQIDSDILHTVSSVLIFSSIVAAGEIRYKRCKSLFYCILYAAIVTGIGAAILGNAFSDRLC